jgi:hypothetical protein
MSMYSAPARVVSKSKSLLCGMGHSVERDVVEVTRLGGSEVPVR